MCEQSRQEHRGSTLRLTSVRAPRRYFDSSRVHDNGFPFFPPEDGRLPPPDTKADYVRWTIDLAQPSGTKVADPQVLVPTPTEFPRFVICILAISTKPS